MGGISGNRKYPSRTLSFAQIASLKTMSLSKGLEKNLLEIPNKLGHPP
jgi:hypothetical protein